MIKKITFAAVLLFLSLCAFLSKTVPDDTVSLQWRKGQESDDEIIRRWMEDSLNSTLVITILQEEETSSSDREAIRYSNGSYCYQDSRTSETYPFFLRISEPAQDEHTYYVLSQSEELDYASLWFHMWELPENRPQPFRVVYWSGPSEENYPQIYDGLDADYLIEAKVLSGIDALPPFILEQEAAYEPYCFLTGVPSSENQKKGIQNWNHMLECSVTGKSSRFYLLNRSQTPYVSGRLYHTGGQYQYADTQPGSDYSKYHFQSILADRDFFGNATVTFYLCESKEYITESSIYLRPSIPLLSINSRELEQEWVQYGTFAPNPVYYN